MTDEEIIMQAMDDEIEDLRKEISRLQAATESDSMTIDKLIAMNVKLADLVKAYEMCINRASCRGCALYHKDGKTPIDYCGRMGLARDLGLKAYPRNASVR